MSTSVRRRRPRGARGARRPGSFVLAALVGVAVVGCGGAENGLEVEDAAPDEAEPAEPAEPADPEPEEEPQAATDDAEGQDDDGWELSAHRPADGSDAGCAAIDQQAPGALIAFPDADDPATLDAGEGPVTVEVVGCSNTFEANLEYEAYHGQDARPTLTGHTMGGSYGDWAEFRFEETYWTPGEWTVVVFEHDAESGDRRDYDEVTFTVE